jgi:hypothetical protein
MSRQLTRHLVVALGLGLALSAAPAAASIWSGYNGAVHLCFAPPDSTGRDSLIAVTNVTAGPAGALVDVYAVLDGVTPVFFERQQVRALGGFELALAIDGAPAEVVSQEFPFFAFNVAQKPGHCSVGVANHGEWPIRNGRALLVHWQVRFAETPRNVRFRLDPAGLISCPGLAGYPEKGLPGCLESGAAAIWAGSAIPDLSALLFGCKAVPAYLNWEGKPDLSVPSGRPTWQETGLFTLE